MTDWQRVEKLLAQWASIDQDIRSRVEIMTLYEERPVLEHRLHMVESMGQIKLLMDELVNELWQEPTERGARRRKRTT